MLKIFWQQMKDLLKSRSLHEVRMNCKLICVLINTYAISRFYQHVQYTCRYKFVKTYMKVAEHEGWSRLWDSDLDKPYVMPEVVAALPALKKLAKSSKHPPKLRWYYRIFGGLLANISRSRYTHALRRVPKQVGHPIDITRMDRKAMAYERVFALRSHTEDEAVLFFIADMDGYLRERGVRIEDSPLTAMQHMLEGLLQDIDNPAASAG